MYDNIADMDGQVGEILKQLADDGLAENTIVFYWSDHGDGVPRAKRSLYDSGLRVPLMIRWPKGLGSTLTPGSVSNDLVSFIDLAPTVLALAGVEVPAHLQGRVLVGPKAGPAPELVFAARDRMDTEYDMMRSARDAPLPLHPQLLARAAVRRPHHLSQPERDHAGVVPAAGRRQADRPGGVVDADVAAGRRALRHEDRSASDSQSVGRAGAPRHARTVAPGGYRMDGAVKRSRARERARDDPAHVARRRAARDRAARTSSRDATPRCRRAASR